MTFPFSWPLKDIFRVAKRVSLSILRDWIDCRLIDHAKTKLYLCENVLKFIASFIFFYTFIYFNKPIQSILLPEKLLLLRFSFIISLKWNTSFRNDLIVVFRRMKLNVVQFFLRQISKEIVIK